MQQGPHTPPQQQPQQPHHQTGPRPQYSRLETPVETNHTFHLIATIFTCGLWAFVWVPVWAINKNRRRTVTSYTQPM